MSEQADATQPEGLVAVDTATEWQRTIFIAPGMEQTLTYDTMEQAVKGQHAAPESAMVSRVETTYYLTPEQAASYTKFAAAMEEQDA